MKYTTPVIVQVFDKAKRKPVNQRVQVTVDLQAAAESLVRKALRAANRRAKSAGGIITVLAG